MEVNTLVKLSFSAAINAPIQKVIIFPSVSRCPSRNTVSLRIKRI